MNSGNCVAQPPGSQTWLPPAAYGSCGDARYAKPPTSSVPCGAIACISPDEQCCQSDVDSGTSPGTYACVPRSSGPCAAGANTIQCDGPEDCLPGMQCTVSGTASMNLGGNLGPPLDVFCSGATQDAVLCHTQADCPASAPYCVPQTGYTAMYPYFVQATLGAYPISVCSSSAAEPPDAAGMVDASGGRDASLPDSTPVDLDGALPDSSDSPVETFEVVGNGSLLTPLSCPTSHWEFPFPSQVPAGTFAIAVRNTGSVPLAYIAEPSGYVGGVVYTPGVPTSESGEDVGVLAVGATTTVVFTGDVIQRILVGSAKPFSIYDSGYAAADEWTVPWPMGVGGSAGSPTMYVAQISWDSACAPVQRP